MTLCIRQNFSRRLKGKLAKFFRHVLIFFTGRKAQKNPLEKPAGCFLKRAKQLSDGQFVDPAALFVFQKNHIVSFGQVSIVPFDGFVAGTNHLF